MKKSEINLTILKFLTKLNNLQTKCLDILTTTHTTNEYYKLLTNISEQIYDINRTCGNDIGALAYDINDEGLINGIHRELKIIKSSVEISDDSVFIGYVYCDDTFLKEIDAPAEFYGDTFSVYQYNMDITNEYDNGETENISRYFYELCIDINVPEFDSETIWSTVNEDNIIFKNQYCKIYKPTH